MVEDKWEKRCKNCTLGMYKEGEIMMWCQECRNYVYYLSVGCKKWEHVEIF